MLSDMAWTPAAGTETVVETRALTRRFGAVKAVDDLNLKVSKGEIFGLVGPDGAGKTTTLRMLCGLIDPSEGQALVASHDVASQSAAVRDRIGYMAQRFGLYHDLTVDENMEFYADVFGIPDAQRGELTPRLLAMSRLEPFRKRQAGKLSGGMKQKLALMCTLLHRPQVLFLDEPTNGVDPVSRRDLWSILYQLVGEGIAIFITTAYLDEAERCNRVGLLHKGRLICLDTPDGLRNGMEEICYQVECPRPREARAWLQTADGVVSVEPSGAALHLFLEPARTSAETLEKALTDRGLGPSRLMRIVPSLEDVFIAMVRKSVSPP